MTTTTTRLPPFSSLMSPPEAKPFDSFNSVASAPVSLASQTPKQSFAAMVDSSNTLPPISPERKRCQSDMNLPSPPVTPYIGSKKRKASTASLDQPVPSRDPVLFPRDEEEPVVAERTASSATSVQPLPADQPLFPSTDYTDELIEQHIAKRAKRTTKRQPTPTREEYKLMATCVSIVLAQYNRNPGAYAKREREILDHQASRMKQYAYSNLKRLAPAPAKRGQTTTATGTGTGSTRVQRPQRSKRTPKSTPRQAALDSFDSSSPAPRATPKPARVIGTNRDDTNYAALPDYSPPLETLRGNAKALKADWKGQMLDLSSDPDRALLDPAELNLAATLRLSCATYLCSKRRIFEARLNALRIGKEFRKTDAQQACKIDVNKASKLWTAYERVGWFRPEYFAKFV